MKFILPTLTLAALAMSMASASAQTVTALTQTSGGTAPGNTTASGDPDFTFFQTTSLTDFNVDPNSPAGGLVYTPVFINTPDGAPNTTQLAVSGTGAEFFTTTTVDLVNFDVLNSAASAYTLSAVFGDPYGSGTAADPGNIVDASFTVLLLNSMGATLSSATENVTDNNTSNSTGLFANFSLTGLVAGDVIDVEASPVMYAGDPSMPDANGNPGGANVQTPYEEGVTFTTAAVPEPSTYAMMFLGAGALVFLARRKLA